MRHLLSIQKLTEAAVTYIAHREAAVPPELQVSRDYSRPDTPAPGRGHVSLA